MFLDVEESEKPNRHGIREELLPEGCSEEHPHQRLRKEDEGEEGSRKRPLSSLCTVDQLQQMLP